jgi:hypothetical protein
MYRREKREAHAQAFLDANLPGDAWEIVWLAVALCREMGGDQVTVERACATCADGTRIGLVVTREGAVAFRHPWPLCPEFAAFRERDRPRHGRSALASP